VMIITTSINSAVSRDPPRDANKTPPRDAGLGE
jgi:hypothetical protein